jgi:PadR family transcriptional regulator PadR
MARMKHQDLLKGLVRLHILHHASKEEFYGQWMIHELARHGYALSPGTLYPMLHALERSGYLRSRQERQGRTFRRIYRATALGREANKIAKVQVRELTGQGRKQRSTVEDESVFTMPWSGTVTYGRTLDEWVEDVCAENRQEYYAGKETVAPIADKPDF